MNAIYSNDSESKPSNLVSAKRVNAYPPTAPVGLVALGHNDNTGKCMTVIWSVNTKGDLGGYEVYRDTSAAFQPDTTTFSNLIATPKTNFLRDSLNLTIPGSSLTPNELYF